MSETAGHANPKSIGNWFGELIPAGTSRNVELTISESYSSISVRIPIHIHRAKEDGPTVFITAALHGDEINGTGAVRQLIMDPEFEITRGSLILVPVLNLLGFDRHSRYMPDRRDLNRSFPGSARGSLSARMARIVFDEIVRRSDYGIDLHTAAIYRTNYPNLRGDMTDPGVRLMAEAFGSEIIIDAKGPKGSLRREACKAGCPTIVMEGGEVSKVEPSIVDAATRGIKNVLRRLDMLDGEIEAPKQRIVVKRSRWMRAELGGFMQFHIKPGDIVEKNQPLATNTTLLGEELNTLHAPFDSIVIGMTSLPAIGPGEALCNLGKLGMGQKPAQLRRSRSEEDGLEQRLSDELGSNVLVVEASETTDGGH